MQKLLTIMLEAFASDTAMTGATCFSIHDRAPPWAGTACNNAISSRDKTNEDVENNQD